MEPFWRRDDWMQEPLAQRLSFSSFSLSVDDIWGYDIKRPYWIVLLPGYTPPADLDRGDKDAMWYSGEIKKPRIAWDGFCPVALFEIIRECFDYAGTSPFIKVVDSETKKVVTDDRDPAIMALRPERMPGWGPRKIQNHIMELNLWASLFHEDDLTRAIYAEMLTGLGKEGTDSVDSYYRSIYFMKKRMFEQSVFQEQNRIISEWEARRISLHGLCDRGTPAGKDVERLRVDNEVPLLEKHLSATIGLASLVVDDFKDSGRPDSFYRFAVRKGEREAKERVERNADRFREAKPDLTPRDGQGIRLSSRDVPLGTDPE